MGVARLYSSPPKLRDPFCMVSLYCAYIGVVCSLNEGGGQGDIRVPLLDEPLHHGVELPRGVQHHTVTSRRDQL